MPEAHTGESPLFAVWFFRQKVS